MELTTFTNETLLCLELSDLVLQRIFSEFWSQKHPGIASDWRTQALRKKIEHSAKFNVILKCLLERIKDTRIAKPLKSDVHKFLLDCGINMSYGDETALHNETRKQLALARTSVATTRRY